MTDTYICNCCGLEFIDYETGLDIYVENSWIITQNAMVDYAWDSYVPMHKTWGELKQHIINNYNECFLKDLPHSTPYKHLYNYYVNTEYDDPIPLTGKLYYEHDF